MKIRNSLPSIIIIVLSMSMFSSCMPGIRHAVDFVNKRQQVAVMVVPPSNTFLYYYPIFTDNDQVVDDSTAIQNSFFLKNLDMKRSTDVFSQSLNDQLRSYDVKVYTPDAFEQFLAFKGPRYIFSIAQTEIIESDQPYTDRTLIDTIIYRQDFLLRSLERNTWFEFVEVDQPEEQSDMKVLYSTFSISDQVNGRFRYRGISGEVYYEYTSRLLEANNIDELNRIAGRGNARYIFEFLLNRHVQKNKRSTFFSPGYFKYQQLENKVYVSKEEKKFLILEPEEIINE